MMGTGLEHQLIHRKRNGQYSIRLGCQRVSCIIEVLSWIPEIQADSVHAKYDTPGLSLDGIQDR